MTTTRRILMTAAFAGLVAACARPVPFTPSGSAAEIRPISLKAENVVVDVEGLSAPEEVRETLEFFREGLEIEEEGGRPVRAILNVHDFDYVDSIVSSLTGSHSALEGEVALEDLATGERLFVSERIRVDSRSVAIPDSGVFTRGRPETKAQKLSKLFMQRARQTLLATNT